MGQKIFYGFWKKNREFFSDHLKKVGFGPIKQSWKSQVQIHDNIIRATNEGEYPLTKLNTGLKVCSAQLPVTHCPCPCHAHIAFHAPLYWIAKNMPFDTVSFVLLA